MSENGVKISTTVAQNKAFFLILVAETLVIVLSTVFTFFAIFASNASHYRTYHPELSGIVGFHFLLPIFVYQVIWLIANVVSAVAVHTTTPYIFFLTVLISFFGLIASIVILVPSVDHVITHNFDVNGLFLGFACVLSLFVISMILFAIARFSTLRKMMKKKKVVQNSVEKSPDDPEAVPADPPARIKDPDEISITFSRRSTMSMNDELYVAPPRR
uniref:Uncharacterized protein n=1 Tax=Caenorhabditis japonica TaxID=281687 RepID=A0A8R1I010_CAEJA